MELRSFGEYKPKGRSVVAVELSRVPVGIRRATGIDDFVVAGVDILVTACSIVMEEVDEPVLDRLTAAADEFPDWDIEWILQGLERFSKDGITTLVTRLTNPVNRKALQRQIGASRFHQLARAFDEDARVFLTAARVGVEYIRPWTIAMDDALAVLSPSQIQAAHIPAVSSFFGAVMQLLAGLDYTLAQESGIRRIPQEQALLVSEQELVDATEQLREIIRGQANDDLSELSKVLERKLNGARDALEHSADGVSQAANSLVELIDRFARQAFSEAEVMAWLKANEIADDVHTYAQAGTARPTKRAHLLCLVWAGTPIVDSPEQMSFQTVAAQALVNVRDKLQKLKHAEQETDEERRHLGDLLRTIEGAVLLMVRTCWFTAGRGPVAELRRKFVSEPSP